MFLALDHQSTKQKYEIYIQKHQTRTRIRCVFRAIHI